MTASGLRFKQFKTKHVLMPPNSWKYCADRRLKTRFSYNTRTRTAPGSVSDNLPIMFGRHRRHSLLRPREANGARSQLSMTMDIVLPPLTQLYQTAVSVRCIGTDLVTWGVRRRTRRGDSNAATYRACRRAYLNIADKGASTFFGASVWCFFQIINLL